MANQPEPGSTTSKTIVIAGLMLAATLVVAGVIAIVPRGTNSDANWGILLPLTGDRAAYGVAMRDGITLAIDEIDGSGGIDGKPIRPVIEDTKGTTRDCLSAFEKLSSLNRVGVILGPMASSEVLSVASIAEQRHVVLFTPSASPPAISDAGDYIFRNVPSDVFEGAAMARVAAGDLKLMSIGVLYVNADYGVGVVGAFRTAYEKLGGKLAISVAYPDGNRDFRTQLQKVKEAGPQALYLVGYKEMGPAVAQARELGLPQQLLSTAIFEDPEILCAAGPAANGLIFTSITFDPSDPDPRAVIFTKNYRERFHREPDGYAASAYDAAHIVAEAARSAHSLEPDRIKDALYRMSGFKGLLGEVKFDERGDVILPIKLKHVVDGRFEKFSPKSP